MRLRLSDVAPDVMGNPFSGFQKTFEARIDEANEFYQAMTPAAAGEDEALVMRQALGGMLWTKQHYIFDGDKWLTVISELRDPQYLSETWVVSSHFKKIPDNAGWSPEACSAK